MARSSTAAADTEAGPHASARSTLFTLLAEFVHGTPGPVRTAALLRVLELAGFTEQAGRQAIARGAAAGWMTGEREGRETRWSLSPGLRRAFDEGPERVFALGDADEDWDGRWLVVVISVPQHQRAARKRLYAGLRWAGLGNPTPGLWLTPHADRVDEVERVIAELDLRASTTSFVGSPAGVGLDDREIVERAWDLDGVAATYAALLDRFSGLDPEPGDAMLLARLELSGALRQAPFVDPQLPRALLPDWIGREAAQQLQALGSAWSPGAHARWHEILAETSPG
ncbi:PaaX family transcriptional regulator [Patulibacter sp. S7RM1-6]